MLSGVFLKSYVPQDLCSRAILMLSISALSHERPLGPFSEKNSGTFMTESTYFHL